MDVVFEGALSRSWGMKDVLQAVIGVPNVPNGVLRVSCPSKNVQGRILISEASHIVGAACNGMACEDPYDSLRTLLEVTEGNFAFLDLTFDSQLDCQTSLYINLERILETMPNFPNSSVELFDQHTLLNKIFGEESFAPPAPPVEQVRQFPFSVPVPMPVPRNRARKPASTKNMAAPITQWNILEPLFNNPQATHTEHLDCCPTSPQQSTEPAQTPDEQRSSMVRLRALPSRNQGWSKVVKNPQPIKWLLSALGLS